LNALAKLLKVLNSETDPGQIALGICFAMIVGLTPLWSPHNLLILFLLLVLRVNLSAFLVAFPLFSGIAYAIDPLSSALGLRILTAPALEGLWTALYNTVPGRLEAFNNSITMGSGIVTLVLFVPVYLAATRLILGYRERILAWVQKTKLMQMLKTSRFYEIYSSISGFAN
jgi:uncharacterized protein (TIGR03546 family)